MFDVLGKRLAAQHRPVTPYPGTVPLTDPSGWQFQPQHQRPRVKLVAARNRAIAQDESAGWQRGG